MCRGCRHRQSQHPKQAYQVEGYASPEGDGDNNDRLAEERAKAAAELVQRSVDPEANIIWGSVIDESLGDEIVITVIATGFETEAPLTSIGVESLVSKAWDKKVNSIPMSSDGNNSSSDLDIPTFLRNKKK